MLRLLRPSPMAVAALHAGAAVPPGPTITITLSNSGLAILDNAAVGEYVGALSASGGVGPYSWSETADASNKFTVASNGAVTLSATVAAGSYTFTAQVTDAGSGGATATQAFTITVTANSASYANAGGTGNRTGSITATTAVGFGGGSPTNLINGTLDNVAFFTNGSTANILTFDFGASTYKNITEIKWYQDTTTTHGNWLVLASNDNSNWRILTSEFLLGGATPFQTIALSNNPYGYRYYRLHHHRTPAASSSPWLREIEFKIAAGPQVPDISTIPDYGNAAGIGNRSGAVAASLSGISTVSGNVADTLNGYLATSYLFSGGSAGAWFKFDFGSAKTIAEVTEYSLGAPTALGTWKYQGSPDDSTWTDIGSSFSWTTADPHVTNLSANATAYRYYRLLHMSGTIFGSDLAEFEFKIAAP